MTYPFSDFAAQASGEPGIFRLMDDLDRALNRPGQVHMLGGGNPGLVPEMVDFYQNAMMTLTADRDRFAAAVGNYDGPAGNLAFREEVAQTLSTLYGWNLDASRVLLTQGSQNAFFMLLNLFSGHFPDGRRRRVLFVQSPEYIGYENAGLHDDALMACPSVSLPVSEGIFRYAVDFDRLEKMLSTEDIGALCLSRPTNPTGGMLDDAEMQKLGSIAARHGIPLIVDGAYGDPFPGIVYGPQRPFLDENTIFVLSLSKAGLPALRTGIVIGPRSVLALIEKLQAIQHLAPGSIGPALLTPGLKDGSFAQACRDHIVPFYRQRQTVAIHTLFSGLKPGKEVLVHRPDGAFFLWAIFPRLKATARQLYDELKSRGVIVVAGDYYYPGLPERDRGPSSSNRALRISYTRDPESLREALTIVGSTVRALS